MCSSHMLTAPFGKCICDQTFVHDQFASGRRFRVLNIVDDVTRECLAAMPDTSISGRRVVRELIALIERRRKPGLKKGKTLDIGQRLRFG